MTATVKIGKPGKWKQESTQNPVEFVGETVEFGNLVSSPNAPTETDHRGETITFK